MYLPNLYIDIYLPIPTYCSAFPQQKRNYLCWVCIGRYFTYIINRKTEELHKPMVDKQLWTASGRNKISNIVLVQ